MNETLKKLKALKNLFNSKIRQPVIDPLRAVKIISEALYMISPELWFRTLQIITKEKFPGHRVYKKRNRNKKSDAKGGDAQQGTG